MTGGALSGGLLVAGMAAVLGGAGVAGAEVVTGHIIAHSHCDPGWLSTFENYYTSDVNRILSSVTDQLLNDPAKRLALVLFFCVLGCSRHCFLFSCLF